MSSENFNKNNSDNFIKCTNCHQNILESKMFLHEGFCLRNNTYCFECGQVVLKKDFEKHLNNHANLKTQNNSFNKKEQIENVSQEKKTSSILINQINNNEYVKMSFQKPKKKEIIKYNEPIIITTPENDELRSPEEYKEFFLKNYKIAKKLNINKLDFTDNQYNNNTCAGNINPTEITENSSVNNYRNNSENSEIIMNEPILKSQEKQNNDKKIYVNNNIFHINRRNFRKKSASLTTDLIFNDYTKLINHPRQEFNEMKLFSPDRNICNTELKEPRNSPKKKQKIIPIEKNYLINNYVHKKFFQNKKNENPQQEKNVQKNKKKEPLDRTSRLAKKNKNSNNEKKQITNMKYSEASKQINRYQKCEYCDRFVEDLNNHIIRCQNCEIKKTEKVQFNQEDKKVFQNENKTENGNNNYLYGPQITSRLRPKYSIDCHIPISILIEKHEILKSEEFDKKKPMDSSKNNKFIGNQVKNMKDIERKSDLLSLREYEKKSDKIKAIPEDRNKKYLSKNNENKTDRNSKTPIVFKEKRRDLDYYVRLLI